MMGGGRKGKGEGESRGWGKNEGKGGDIECMSVCRLHNHCQCERWSAKTRQMNRRDRA